MAPFEIRFWGYSDCSTGDFGLGGGLVVARGVGVARVALKIFNPNGIGIDTNIITLRSNNPTRKI